MPDEELESMRRLVKVLGSEEGMKATRELIDASDPTKRAINPSSDLQAACSVERWSGHGEGGEIAHIRVTGGVYSDGYNSSPEQIAQAKVDADWINELIRTARAQGK